MKKILYSMVALAFFSVLVSMPGPSQAAEMDKGAPMAQGSMMGKGDMPMKDSKMMMMKR